ncbi:MAG: helix-turn-helix transcriptional regulator [Planctomycetales bacterium]|nr:helix-turn-helix transcriptional regulator [Planctomycetales bacterium]
MNTDVPDFEWFIERLKLDCTCLSDEQQLVRDAVELIWRGLSGLSGVDEVVAQLPATRRTLERRFRCELGRGIGEVVSLARLELAKWLLTQTAQPIHAVARRSGYSSSDSMGKAIHRDTGMTPTEYRGQDPA